MLGNNFHAYRFGFEEALLEVVNYVYRNAVVGIDEVETLSQVAT